ncbi:MAG: hypothetical protein KDD46_00210 [Bdellovibrionales bacterium]|nr:hypothetical protein [Bdellovibrionales bacterium]
MSTTSCQLPPILAQMQANINISSQTQSSQNSVANVNFTAVNREVISGQTIISFSNSDGYTIQFQLLGANVGAGTYDMGSGNSLTGSFTLTNNGQAFVVNVVSTSLGELVINSINASDSTISSMVGSFEVNITSGDPEQDADGVLVGTISF